MDTSEKTLTALETLQKRAHEVYTKDLSVTKKRKLIAQLESEIDTAYKDWGDTMVEFIKKNSFLVWKIYDRFRGYGVAEKRGVIIFEYHRGCIAYYVLNGKLAATEWDDGDPNRITSEKIQQKRDTDKQLDVVLAAFVATHPELKE